MFAVRHVLCRVHYRRAAALYLETHQQASPAAVSSAVKANSVKTNRTADNDPLFTSY